MPTRDKQIGERAGHEQAMSVLFEPAIAHLGEAEDPLDDPDWMLDFGPHLRFGPVCRALDFVHDAAMAVAAIGEVPRLGCVLADHCLLAAIRLVAPHAGFRCRATGGAAPCCRRHWPASPPPRGSTCCGCRPRNALSCQSTTGCLFSSDASRDLGPCQHSWLRTAH